MGNRLPNLYPRIASEQHGPESRTRRERRAACRIAIAENPGCLPIAVVINFSHVNLLESDTNAQVEMRSTTAQIARRIGERGFGPKYLGIAAVHSGKKYPGRPAKHFEYCADQLAQAFVSPDRLIEVSSYDQTEPVPEGVDPHWAPLENFAMSKVTLGQRPPDAGFIVVTGARNAAKMMGFEQGSPQDVALHPGAILLSAEVPALEAERTQSLRTWTQLPMNPTSF